MSYPSAPGLPAAEALAGAGATPQVAAAVGARLMAGDPVTGAERAGRPR
jgi:hypothetical protein